MPATISTERWTYQDMVEKLPAESRYELRDFNLLKLSAPTTKHQIIILNIIDSIKPITKVSGKFFIGPLDIVFQNSDVSQPDLIFVSAENLSIVLESYISGAPDLLVEVVSKGSVARDYVEKKNDYEKFGVKEYWIVDSLNETIWIYALNDASKYELFSYAEEGEKALSKLFPEFSLDHDLIFEE